jgi:glycosyltransferase involved in cell wall biosynthesis
MSTRILHVITGIDRGGAENHLLDLVRHQGARGFAVSVAYLRGNGYWTNAFTELGAGVYGLGLRFYGDLRPLMKLRRVIESASFELVHAHLPPAELYVRLALLGISPRALPMLITKHNEERFCEVPGQRLLGRWVADRAAHVITISDAVKRFMVGSGLGLDARKLRRIYYGIDASNFGEAQDADARSLRNQWNIPLDALVIGFVGRLVEQKDIGTLLHGMARFAAESPKARLVIVGTGPAEAALRRLVNELRISDLIVWAGFREDIRRVMGSFDIFALTSIYEGFGLVLLEAMASRRAVVATRVGAIPEVVGAAGLLVRARSPDELAAAFHQLSDPSLRVRLGEAGRQRVLNEFTLERMWEETDALYEQCLHREKARSGKFFRRRLADISGAASTARSDDRE